MGQKASVIGSKILSGISAVAKAVPDVISGTLEGGALGTAALPGLGTVLGGVGGGLMKGISHISDVVDAVKGNGQTVPFQPEHVANTLSDGWHAVQSAGQLKQLLPEQHQTKLEQALASASQGKIAQGISQTGKFATSAANQLLLNMYKGKTRHDQLEKVHSPSLQQVKAMISPAQRKELGDQRSVAHMAELIPVSA